MLANKVKLLFVVFLFSTFTNTTNAMADNAIVVVYKSGCKSYFLADGENGYYLLEWYGGYDPTENDLIVGDINSFGFKDVSYPRKQRTGRVYVDDYNLSKQRALEKYIDKCD